MKRRPSPWKCGVGASAVVLAIGFALGVSHFHQSAVGGRPPAEEDRIAMHIAVALVSLLAFPVGVIVPVLARTKRGLLFLVIAVSLFPVGVWVWFGFLILCFAMLFVMAILGGLYLVGLLRPDDRDDLVAGLFYRLVLLRRGHKSQKWAIDRLAKRVSAFGSRECFQLMLNMLNDSSRTGQIRHYAFRALAPIDDESVGKEVVRTFLGLNKTLQAATSSAVCDMVRNNSSFVYWGFDEIDRLKAPVFVDILLSCLNCRRVGYHCLEILARTVDEARLGKFIMGGLRVPADAHRNAHKTRCLMRYDSNLGSPRRAGYHFTYHNWEPPEASALIGTAIVRLGVKGAPLELTTGASSDDAEVRKCAIEVLRRLSY